MEPGDQVELDARIALTLGVGYTLPPLGAERAEYAHMEDQIDQLKARAARAGTVKVTPWDVAHSLAELAGVNEPTRPETTRLLDQLVLDIQDRGILNAREVYLIRGLQDSGWPVPPWDDLMTNLIAAADLGDPDPPSSSARKPLTPPPTNEHGEPRFIYLIGPEPESAFVVAERDRANQSPPDEPRTVHEQFDWESLLGAIVDALKGELVGEGYLDIGPG